MIFAVSTRSMLKRKIQERARELGFTLCGFAPVEPLPREQFFTEWLAQGHAGEMQYLARAPERRLNPLSIFPQAKSVICLAYPYAPPRLPDIDWRQDPEEGSLPDDVKEALASQSLFAASGS